MINRAPVLTAWVAVVAQREGYSRAEGLSFGRWISGMLAQIKGRSLGIYQPREKSEEEKASRRRRDARLGAVEQINVFGKRIPAVVKTDDDDDDGGGGGGKYRAVSEGKPIAPESVEAYLKRSFGAEFVGLKRFQA